MSDKFTSDTDIYRVVLFNQFKHGANESEIQQRVAARLDLNEQDIARIFASRPIVIQNSIDATSAFELHITLNEIGALSYIEPMPDFDDTDADGYIERRYEQRREQQERRAQTRIGQIMPDRRISERREDED